MLVPFGGFSEQQHGDAGPEEGAGPRSVENDAQTGRADAADRLVVPRAAGGHGRPGRVQ